MSPTDEPYADPLIDEVRERRRELFAECDNDLNKLLELIEDRQKRRPDMIVDRQTSKMPRE